MKRLQQGLALLLAVLFLPFGTNVSAKSDHAAVYGTDIVWIYRCNRQADGAVALTFDDGPHPKLTPIILDILKQYEIKATFFMIGENAERYPELVNRICEEGHEIGNHTYSHIQTTKTDRIGLENEVLRCEEIIGSISDTRPKYFRPPQGAFASDLGSICDALGYRVILWSTDTRDWCHIPPDEIAANVLHQVRGGDIILMHDYIGHDSPTPDALKKTIPALIARGYEFKTISELLDAKAAFDSSRAD